MLEHVTTQPLSPVDCRRLLARATIGRIAFTDRAMPAIAAVPCRLLGPDEVLLAVPAGSRTAQALHDAVVAFQVDDLEGGWTVHVVGETQWLAAGRSSPAASELAGPDTVLCVLRIDVLDGRTSEPAVRAGATHGDRRHGS